MREATARWIVDGIVPVDALVPEARMGGNDAETIPPAEPDTLAGGRVNASVGA